MKLKLLFIFAAILFSSCARVDYIGNTATATSNVEVFMEKDQIKKPYEILGTASVHDVMLANPQTLQKKLVEKAKQYGADAVLITGIEKVHTGTSSSTNASSEKNDNKSNYNEHTYTSDSYSKVLNAKLIKYK